MTSKHCFKIYFWRFFRWFIVATALASCTSVTSRVDRSNNLGLAYFLPTTRIPMAVAFDVSSDSIQISGGDPVYIPDGGKRYFLNSIFSPVHKETVDLKIDNGLLQTFSVKSQSQVSEIAQGLARSGALGREFSTTVSGRTVYTAQLDLEALAPRPGTRGRTPALQSLNKAMNVALQRELRTAYGARQLDDKLFLRHVLDSSHRLLDFDVQRVTPYIAPDYEGEPDCSAGFCYRLPVAYKLTAEFSHNVRHEKIILVPNGSPTYVAAINRGVFADWTNNITITNGVLTGYKYETSKSELLGAVTLPFEVIGASLEAITQQGTLFTTRTGRINKEIAYLEALTKLEEARANRLGAERSSTVDPAFSFTFGQNVGSGQIGRDLDTSGGGTSSSTIRQSGGSDGTG